MGNGDDDDLYGVSDDDEREMPSSPPEGQHGLRTQDEIRAAFDPSRFRQSTPAGSSSSEASGSSDNSDAPLTRLPSAVLHDSGLPPTP